MDNLEIQTFDQNAAFIAENYPPFIKRFYDNCLEQGFDDATALYLTTKILEITLPR